MKPTLAGLMFQEPRPLADPHDIYWDVEPIPFYPDDLPRLEIDPFDWTPAELEDAAREARRLLFPLRNDTDVCKCQQAETDQRRTAH